MNVQLPSLPENEVTILARVLSKGRESLAPHWARQLLALKFSKGDEARINTLAERNRQGLLSEAERAELQGYAKAGCLLGILQSKARQALKEGARAKKRRRNID